MACDSGWTIKFFGVNEGDPLEIRPRTLSLKLERNEFDFCRAETDPEVGEVLKPHTRYSDGKLNGQRRVGICYQGDVIHNLLFRPDYVDYGSNGTHFQFHDLQKSLDSGSIEWQKERVKLRTAYKRAFEARENDLIQGIKFTIPENLEGYGTGHFVNEIGFRIKELDGITRTLVENNPFEEEFDNKEASNTARLIESYHAIDFDNITPLEAIFKLNKQYNIVTSINRSGELVVGTPEAFSVRHLAAAKDNRVWRFSNVNISHSSDPIQRVAIEGNYLEKSVEQRGSPYGIPEKKTLISYGVAERQDIDYGRTLTFESPNPNRGELPQQAEFKLRQLLRKQKTGSVQIDPSLSGSEISSVIDLDIGHVLHLIPDDDLFDNPTAESGHIGSEPDNPDAACRTYVKNEGYAVTGLEHNLTKGGHWQVHADVSLYPDNEIASSFELLDPKENEFVENPEEVLEELS